ncbi:MAG: hypothetical protein ACOYON_04645 [Fimbriimonas sp.]
MRELLERIHQRESALAEITQSHPNQVTVEDIAEALDLDPEEVARELEQMHREHREARISGVLRELEEPLYRVERPAPSSQDSMSNPLLKMRSIRTLSDRLNAPVLPRRKKVDHSDNPHAWVGTAIMGFFGSILLILLIKMIITVFSS